MNDENERFKELRAITGLSQEAFGEAMGLSKSGISNIENGIRKVTDQHVKLICNEFNVNEEWLRHGTGEMFIENDSTIIAELASEYRLDAIDQKIIEHYVKLDDGDRQKIKQYVLSLAQQIASMEESAATTDKTIKNITVPGKTRVKQPSDSVEVDPIEAELESYRQELEAEKKGRILSASPAESEPS